MVNLKNKYRRHMQEKLDVITNKLSNSRKSKKATHNTLGFNSFSIQPSKENHAFFSVISHNIKNPFSTLLGFSDLLFEDFDELDNEEKKFYLSEIKKSAKFTYQYIEKFFEWIYYKTGKIKLEFQSINVKETVKTIIGNLENQKNLKIPISVQIDDAITVYADPDSFEKIIYNLIDNAIKFTTSNPKIVISAREYDTKIQISIQDNGIGIAPEDISKLFNISIDPVTIGNSNNKGIGLGLILTKELITLNKGIINVESSIEKGSIFSIILPVGKNKN